MADLDPRDGEWHLDKKVPIALMIGMALQVIVFAWWGGGFSNRVDQIERQLINYAPQGERIIRLETKVDALGQSLTEIKSLIRTPANERH